MLRLRSLLPLALFLAGLQPLAAQCSDDSFHDEGSQRDYELVQEFINAKRSIPLKEIESEFKLFGSLQTDIRYRHEKLGDCSLRGGGAKDGRGVPIRRNEEELEFNLRASYSCGKAWLEAHLELDHSLGIFHEAKPCSEDPQGLFGSGSWDEICLKKAIFGYRIWEKDKKDLTIEIGRNRIYKQFDSRVQYDSLMDGIFIKYGHEFEPSWKIYAQAAGFVVDERANHYAYIVELGTYDFYESRVDLKYSFIDWAQARHNRCGVSSPRGIQFKNSQWFAAYNFREELLGKKARLYGAFILNHAAKRRLVSPRIKANRAGYIGFIIGDVEEARDWSFDINWQVVEWGAVPNEDSHGIGKGFVSFSGDPGDPTMVTVCDQTYPFTDLTKTNYKGVHSEFLYALTDKISLDVTYEVASSANERILDNHLFRKFELDLILAF